MIATEQQIDDFLLDPGTIAIVGASTDPKKAGYLTPMFLQRKGFKLVPINPFADEIFGEKTLGKLEELETPVKGVIIYRSARAAGIVAERAAKKGIPLIWLPTGVVSEVARNAAEEHDLLYVEDKCPYLEYKRLFKRKKRRSSPG